MKDFVAAPVEFCFSSRQFFRLTPPSMLALPSTPVADAVEFYIVASPDGNGREGHGSFVRRSGRCAFPARAYDASGAPPPRWARMEDSQSPLASLEEEGLTDPPSQKGAGLQPPHDTFGAERNREPNNGSGSVSHCTTDHKP